MSFTSDVIELVIEKLAAPKFIKVLQDKMALPITPELSNQISDITGRVSSIYNKERQIGNKPLGMGSMSYVYPMFAPRQMNEFMQSGAMTKPYPLAKKVHRYAYDLREGRTPSLAESYQAIKKNPSVYENNFMLEEGRSQSNDIPTVVAAHKRSATALSSSAPNSGIKAVSEIQKRDKNFYDMIPQSVDSKGNIYQPLVNKFENSGELTQQNKEYTERNGLDDKAPGLEKFIDRYSANPTNPNRPTLYDLHGDNVGNVPSDVNQHLSPELHGTKALDYMYANLKRDGSHGRYSKDQLSQSAQLLRPVPKRFNDPFYKKQSFLNRINKLIYNDGMLPNDARIRVTN